MAEEGEMKRLLLSIMVIGILLLGACGTPTTAPAAEAPPTPTAPMFTGGPRISFEKDSVYLGEATPDQRMLYDFRFQNVGDAPLIIYEATIKILQGC